MLRRGILSLVLLVLLSSILGAQEFVGPYTVEHYQQSDDPVPYQINEFPDWAYDLRRFEVIFFGSIPIMYLFTNLAYDFTLYAINDFSSDFAMGTQRSQQDYKNMLITTVSLSGAIAITDYIIGQVKESKQKNIKDE